MLFDEALRALWMQWMFCRESLTTKDISAELTDVIDFVINVLQENVSSLIYVLLRENMHLSTILRFNDFHMEQFCHVCWKEGHLLQFFYFCLLSEHWAVCIPAHLTYSSTNQKVFLQGRYTRAIQLYDKMDGFLRKIRRWREHCGGGNIFHGSFSAGMIVQYVGAPSKNSQGAPTLDQLIR